MLLGTYHQEENHWSLVCIDLVKREVLYIDPLAPPNEHNKAKEFADHWMEWALLHNQYSPNAAMRMHLEPVTMNHACAKRWALIAASLLCVYVNVCIIFSYQMKHILT